MLFPHQLGRAVLFSPPSQLTPAISCRGHAMETSRQSPAESSLPSELLPSARCTSASSLHCLVLPVTKVVHKNPVFSGRLPPPPLPRELLHLAFLFSMLETERFRLREVSFGP